MPLDCTASWQAGTTRPIPSVHALDTLLDELVRECDAGSPLLVDVTRANGDTLTIGLGYPNIYLTYNQASGLPPYLASLAETVRGGIVVFYYFGHWTEVPAQHLVPAASARNAVREFARTGELSDELCWVES